MIARANQLVAAFEPNSNQKSVFSTQEDQKHSKVSAHWA